MQIEGWTYYNHAAVPTTPPHVEPDIMPIEKGTIWDDRGVLLARWITEWDCGYETNWWYCIKDTPFNISELNAKRRYETNKGRKYYDVQKIDPALFKQDLFETTRKAYLAYPEKYRPRIQEEQFKQQIDGWNELTVIGAIHRESGILQGYAYLRDYESYSELNVLKADPEMEKYAINAALMGGVLDAYRDKLNSGYYISDGQRAILHETAFQEYLEKYFGFRKAYCKLHLKYRPGVGVAVNMLYPFKDAIKGRTRIGSQIAAVLRMEEISRAKVWGKAR